MCVVEFNRERIENFCAGEKMKPILTEIKWLWRNAIIYAQPANVIDIKIYGDDVNISDIVDIVLKHNPGWERDAFLRGRYGFFISCTEIKNELEDIVL